jgi:hypothetical protein
VKFVQQTADFRDSTWSTAFCNCICKFSNFKFVFFEGDEGEAEANPTLLLDDRDDAFLKHNANLPVSTNYH